MNRPAAPPPNSARPQCYGVLDLTAAFINTGIVSGATPTRVLKSVAGGLLGRSAYEGGFGTVALGLVLHFTMALTVATVFYVLSRRYPALVRHPASAGLLYGLAVFVVNNFGTVLLVSWFRSLICIRRSYSSPRWDGRSWSFTCSASACPSLSCCGDIQITDHIPGWSYRSSLTGSCH
jgi:hypothetical protein